MPTLPYRGVPRDYVLTRAGTPRRIPVLARRGGRILCRNVLHRPPQLPAGCVSALNPGPARRHADGRMVGWTRRPPFRLPYITALPGMFLGRRSRYSQIPAASQGLECCLVCSYFLTFSLPKTVNPSRQSAWTRFQK
jgi:hypothetical protein